MTVIRESRNTDNTQVVDTSEMEPSNSNSGSEEVEAESHNEESSADENGVNSDNDDNSQEGNAGWADSIAKILKTNKPKRKRTLVLSKAKKLTDVKKSDAEYVGFEIEGKDGDIKKEKLETTQKVAKIRDEPPRKKKRELPNLRVKPKILEKDRERTLTKIATKGVVQLFNAVKMQQKDISTKLKEAGPLEVKRDKVLKNIDKRAFLDVLMGEKSEKVDEVVSVKTASTSSTQNSETKESVTWGVLRDDFMMGAKMKDWDKQLEDEMESENNIESE